MLKELLKNRKVTVSVLVTVLFIIFLITKASSFSPLNPAKDKLNEDVDGGKKYALVYKFGDFLKLANNNSDILPSLKKDLNTYARKVFPDYYENESVLCGFTFEKGYKTSGDQYIFKGRYYGVGGTLTLTVKKIPYNLVRVLIRDEDNYQIDDELILSGAVNKFIDKLPIEKDDYSVRYSKNDGKVLVAFYTGYTAADVEEVEKLMQDNFGSNYLNQPSIEFIVSGVGQFPLPQIKDDIAQLSAETDTTGL